MPSTTSMQVPISEVSPRLLVAVALTFPGAPVTVNNKLVGMIHGAFTEGLPTCIIKYIPLHTPAVTMSINSILADLAAKDRPGAGFVPTSSPAPGPA